MSIESEEDLEGLRRAGRVAALALRAMREAVREGISTAELDDVAARVLCERGARSAPNAVDGFPAPRPTDGPSPTRTTASPRTSSTQLSLPGTSRSS